MKVTEAREALRKLTEYYFQGAIVKYAQQSFAVKPTSKPLVNLTFGAVKRALNPPMQIVDGRPAAFYPTSITVQVDLFTKGKRNESSQSTMPVMENPAVEDLLAFMSFLNSTYAISYCHNLDMAIVVPDTVEDLTDIVNDTQYEFRAMAELELHFTTIALGYTGSLTLEGVTKTVEVDADGNEVEEPQTPTWIGGATEADTQGGTEAVGTKEKQFDFTKDEANEKTTLTPETEITPSGGGNSNFVSEEEGYFTSVEINDKVIKKQEEE